MSESPIATSGERRVRRAWRTPGPVVVPLAAVWLMGLVVLSIAAQRTDAQVLFFDPAMSGSDPKWYVGAISQLGILAWSIAALSAAWSAWFARHVGRPKAARFLARGAFATTVLLLDDLFVVHAVASNLLGVPKVVLAVLVVVPAALWAWRHLQDIARTRWPLLAVAVASLALSMIVERSTGNSFSARATLAEDSPKFLGVLAWATYFALTSVDIARSVLTQTHTPRVGGEGDIARSVLRQTHTPRDGGEGGERPSIVEPVNGDRLATLRT